MSKLGRSLAGEYGWDFVFWLQWYSWMRRRLYRETKHNFTVEWKLFIHSQIMIVRWSLRNFNSGSLQTELRDKAFGVRRTYFYCIIFENYLYFLLYKCITFPNERKPNVYFHSGVTTVAIVCDKGLNSYPQREIVGHKWKVKCPVVIFIALKSFIAS